MYGLTLTLADDSALPAWMSFAGLTLTIDPAPASPGDKGIYEVHAKRFETRYPDTYFQTDLVTCTLTVVSKLAPFYENLLFERQQRFNFAQTESAEAHTIDLGDSVVREN